jgi:hypothetical protein
LNAFEGIDTTSDMKRGILFMIGDKRMMLIDQPLNNVDSFSLYGGVKTTGAVTWVEEGVQPLNNVDTTVTTGEIKGRQSVDIERGWIDKGHQPLNNIKMSVLTCKRKRGHAERVSSIPTHLMGGNEFNTF